MFRGIDQHKAVLKLVLRSGKQIAEKTLQKLGIGFDALLDVAVIRPDQRVAEVPRMLAEELIIHREAHREQIFDREDRRGAGVAFAKHVDLPNAGNEFRNMRDNLRERQSLITELLFPVKVMIQRPAYLVEADIQHRIAAQYPFALGDIGVAKLPGELEYSLEDAPIDGGITDGREGKGLLVDQLST